MISVIVPVYRVEAYLDKCVESIVNQTYRGFELLLVDDGSPDRCGDMCEEWAKKDPRIRVIHKENGGLSDARNAGIEQAKGEYICFADSDDWMAEDMLETLHGLVEKTQADMAIANYARIAENGELAKEINHFQEGVFTQEQFWQQFFANRYDRTYYAVSWNKIYKRKIFDTLRYRKGAIHQDVLLLYDIVSQCDKIALSDKVVYYYLQRSNGIVRSGRSTKNLNEPEAYLNNAEKFKDKEQWYFAGFSLDIAIRYLLMREYGENGKQSKQYLEMKQRAKALSKALWPHLSKKKQIRFFLFFHCSPLARMIEDAMSRKWQASKKHNGANA